jgi:transposase
MTEGAPQRGHALRELSNAVRWLVRAGAPWRLMPGDLPPWPAVYQQTQRWLRAGCFSDVVADFSGSQALPAQLAQTTGSLDQISGVRMSAQFCLEC